MKTISAALFVCVCFPVLFRPAPGYGEVYKWTDADGKVHYSSKAPKAGAKPADLPPIMRGEVKLTAKKMVSCEPHGGVNCQLGPDADGSVICYDGFREASARFRFTCSSPKLEISDVSDLNETGGFSVFVRNSKSVAANKTALAMKLPNQSEVKLAGPEEIAPFGLAEFTYKPQPGMTLSRKPTIEHLELTCENCP